MFNQTKYVNEYTKEKYDRIQIIVKKGEKEQIQKTAKEKGFKSTNEYIINLIHSDMEKA